MKRALRMFGNRLGNCAYDKMFLKEVKGKPAGSTNNLVRAANYPPKRSEAEAMNTRMSRVGLNPNPSIPQPVQLQPQSSHVHVAQHHQEIMFDDSVFDNSMMISEEDFVLDEAAFMADENNGANANATFPSAGIYPLPPRPTTRK